MDACDLDVIQACQRWQLAGHDVVLVTVLSTWGSAPRPPGAMMALRADGAVAGSVSGGCIEDDLMRAIRINGAAGLCPDHLPCIRSYGILAEEARRFGLPCGGTLRLVLEPLRLCSQIDELMNHLAHRRPVERMVNLSTGHVQIKESARDFLPTLTEQQFKCSLGPRHRIIAIGAGQLSRYFCQTATGLGFDVLVCDPRQEYCTDWNLPQVRLTHEMPDDVLIGAQPDARTAVVTLTHDPKLDDLALIHALQSPAFYVGALGSRSNHKKRVDRLREHFSLTEAELSRLRGPAGIYIGSKTPPEIALSILCEIVAVKNAVDLSWQVDSAKNQLELQSV